MNHEFITLDDSEYVTENPWVKRGLDGPAVRWAFTTGHASNWHPLTWLSHQLDCQLFGLNPMGPHAVNLAWHVANTILLLLLLHQLTGKLGRSAVVAALFAWHPLHVESVAWVAERKDLLSGFFGLTTLLAYAAYAQAKTEGRRLGVKYSVALGLFALGLMSKPMLVTWPFVLLLLDFWPLNRVVGPIQPKQSVFWQQNRALLVEKIPFFLIAAGSSLVTYLVQQRGGAMSSGGNLPMEDRLINAAVSYIKYLRKTVWPNDLAIFYPHPELRFSASEQWPTVGVAGAVLLLVVLTGLAWRYGRQAPAGATGWFWFVGTLVPTIGLVQVGTQALADRYTYLPLIGLFVGGAWLSAEWLGSKRWGQGGLIGLAGVSLAGCLWLGRQQVNTWQNTTTVFEHALAVTGRNHVAHSGLGKVLAQQGRMDEARQHFRAALDAYPFHPDAHYDLGAIYLSEGNYAAAAAEFEAQIRTRPGHIASYNALAVCQGPLGHPEKEKEYFTMALQLDPKNAGANFGLGMAALAGGDFEEAAGYLERAQKTAPDFDDATLALSRVWTILGNYEAVANLLRQPADSERTPEMEFLLANATAALGNGSDAKRRFDAATQAAPELVARYEQEAKGFIAREQGAAALAWYLLLDRWQPGNAETLEQIGALLAAVGRLPEAQPYLEKAIAIRPTAKTQYHLAMVRGLRGDSAGAIRALEAAVTLAPDWATGLNELAWILATHPNPEIRDGARAVALAERACALGGGTEVRYWGTLDAAYAEAGRFAEAIRGAEKTRQLAQEQKQPELAQAAENRLELYRQGRPFHQ